MKKLKLLTLIISISIVLSALLQTHANSNELASENCLKGDKILDYYENLEDKSNPNRYLNAAKYYYYQASRNDLSEANALVGHARVALYQNRIKDAKNVLMIALNFNEDNPKVNFYLGETFFADEEYTQAIDFYNHAYNNGYQSHYKTNFKLGICYAKLNEEEKAKFHYNKALQIKPDSTEVKNKLDKLESIKTNYKNVEEI